MLFLSLIALITGAVFLWLDYSQYGEKKLTLPPDRPAASAPKGTGEVQPPPVKDKGAGM